MIHPEDPIADGGSVNALMRTHDWSASPFGSPAGWPQSFKTIVRLVLESPFPMFVAWGDEFIVIYNDAYSEILGGKHPAAFGKPFRDVWPKVWPELRPLMEAAMAGHASHREDIPLVVNRTGDDEQVWFTCSYSPIRDESDTIAGVFCVVAETTQRVRTEQILRERNETLARRVSEGHAERRLLGDIVESGAFVEAGDLDYRWLTVLGQLTGGVVQEFNNVFAVFGGAVNLFERTHQPPSPRALELMRRAVARGMGLTRHLLAFSRRRPIHVECIDLVEHLNGMRAMLASLGGQIQLRMMFAADIWPIEVDPSELELAIVNLCLNARDAMPAGGAIIIAVANIRDADNRGWPGDFVRLTIADEGIGMSPAVQARVFEPFFTTKDPAKNAGLGLTQVSGFADHSRGRVTIDSEIGAGTVVTLLLPRRAHRD
jgi:PAS domain S-box-containing protein